MRIVRLFLLILLFILFMPFITIAETCDSSSVTIESVTIENKSDTVDELDTAVAIGKNLNINLSMTDVGDSIEYKVVIKNASNEDFEIDKDSLDIKSNYINYTIETEDNSNIVEANSSKAVYLKVNYVNEVPNESFESITYNDSKTMVVKLSTSDNVIVPDTLKNHNIMVLVFIFVLVVILLISMIITVVQRKKKYYIFMFLIFGIVIIMPFSVNAICKCDITIVSNIEIVNKEFKSLYNTIEDISKDNSCVTKYNGNVTDEVGKTVEASNVYFDSCEGQRNVIFGGYCWEVIRTTETKGTKLMYNGVPVDGKCLSTREGTVGVRANSTWPSIDPNYLYGSSYTLDLNTGQFTIKDTFNSEFTKENLPNLINKYTCLSEGDSCSYLYLISGMYSNNSATAARLYLYGFPFNYIGLMPFNSDEQNISSVGYMFNKQSPTTRMVIGSEMIKYASSFTYDSDTNTYTLTGNSQTIMDVESSTQLNDTRYTCLNESGTCEVLRYVISTSYSSYAMSEITYIDLTDGDGYRETINKEIKDDDINKYDSTIKKFVDDWYENNFIEYSNRLENTVYCNNRETSFNGFDSEPISKYIKFKQYDLTNNLECNQLINQFSVNNEKAKLKYPVALITAEELKNVNYNLIKGGYFGYWTMTPGEYGGNNTYMYWVSSDTFYRNNGTNRGYGVRPVISLKKNNYISGGSGSENDPWIIE